MVIEAVKNNSSINMTTNPVVNPKDVPYIRSKSELLEIRSNIQAMINAGFDGWKQLFSSSNPEVVAYLDLSTTSRASNAALGHNVRMSQAGYNELEPDSSWMMVENRHQSCGAKIMDCYC